MIATNTLTAPFRFLLAPCSNLPIQSATVVMATAKTCV